MAKNLTIIILIVASISLVIFMRGKDYRLIAGIILLSLMIIALVQYLSNKTKKISQEDTLPSTKYTYDPAK